MIEALFRFLITLVCLAIVVALSLWVLAEVGIIIPVMVLHLFYVLAALIVLLILWRMLIAPYAGAGWWTNWWGPRAPPP